MSLYSFIDLLQGIQTLRDAEAAEENERSVLDDRVKTLTAGEKRMVDVVGDGNCMVHAFIRSAQIADSANLARQNAVEWLRANPNGFVQVGERCYGVGSGRVNEEHCRDG